MLIMSMGMVQEEGRAQEGEGLSGGSARRMPRRSVVRSLSTMHMMGFTPLGFFETVSEGENLVEGHMALPTGAPPDHACLTTLASPHSHVCLECGSWS